MIILLVAAVVSIALGTGIEAQREEGAYIDGIAILCAVIVVVLVSACNDYSKEKQFRKLNAVKDNKTIKVIRDSAQKEISTHDIVTGDIIILITGDQIPADGVMINGNDV